MDSSDNAAEFYSFNNLIRIDELTATNSSISFDTTVSRKKKQHIFSANRETFFISRINKTSFYGKQKVSKFFIK